jgi:hypothetical protein
VNAIQREPEQRGRRHGEAGKTVEQSRPLACLVRSMRALSEISRLSQR